MLSENNLKEMGVSLKKRQALKQYNKFSIFNKKLNFKSLNLNAYKHFIRLLNQTRSLITKSICIF